MNLLYNSLEIETEISQNNELLGTQSAEKHRERNRVHAKRTRQRKKEMTEAMKMRLLDLQKEAADLEQLLQESTTASILICLGEKSKSSIYQDDSSFVNIPEGNIVDHLKSRVREDIAKKRQKQEVKKELYNNSEIPTNKSRADSVDSNSNDATTSAEAATNSGNEINSNNDTSSNDNGSNNNNDKDDDIPFSGHNEDRKKRNNSCSKSCIKEIDTCNLDNNFDKRERNRVHAKHTRDRKKLLNSRMQKLILTLEHHNKSMRDKLSALVRGEPLLYQM